MSYTEQHCQSCGIPLSAPEARGTSDKYCTYCTDSEGNLKSWDDAVSGLAEYLDSWQKVGNEEARKRAIRYLTSMPAWADRA
ncbi:zinc ribbon domain-containing protein [Kosakonia oryziphila]|uniref:Putative zinc ribbon domain-containing protein n=1 Tax=Kosakonia oryziphila TaxID=1005667 RepID=A0A1C4GAN9_9ENTR|nr:zinc ribbon domain-containing protein [Kosakonia oryziphila]SCC65260.1 Putative zinc ribbon domain-containing protein [Kosakonia oryziphila]